MKYTETMTFALGSASLPSGHTLSPQTKHVHAAVLETSSQTRSGGYAAAKMLAVCLLGGMLALSASPALGQAGHIHELYYNNADWTDTDLTSLTGVYYASPFAGMTAYVTTPNGQFHVYYQDASGYIHQFYFNGTSWSDENLTVAARGVLALTSGSGMAGFSIGNYQYVYFVGGDKHIHEFA